MTGDRNTAACHDARRPTSRPMLIRERIDLRNRGEWSCISFERCIESNLGLNVRRRQARRCISSTLRPYAKMQWETESDAVIALTFADPRIWTLLDNLTERLAALADRPLTPRELLIALPITNKERLRWTKDGRLARSGAVTIKRGHLISVPTYSVAVVERIRADLAVIEAWREIDHLFT